MKYNQQIETPFILTDSYKWSHWLQYPNNIVRVYSNITARRTRRTITHGKVVVAGLNYTIAMVLSHFDEFFAMDEEAAVENFRHAFEAFNGSVSYLEDSVEKVRSLHKLGYLPVVIEGLQEGTMVPYGTPVAVIYNTEDEFYWVTNFLETIISNLFWSTSTSATTASIYRVIAEYWNNKTSDQQWFVDWQCHDFSMRGLTGIQGAIQAGMGHLLYFKGTDNLPAWSSAYNKQVCFGEYNQDYDVIGGSVPATEHSVQQSFMPRSEDNTYMSDVNYLGHTLILYPTGIVSVVSDGYDFWRMITDVASHYHDVIMNRDGKVVFRPDSSPKTPVEIIIGDSEAEPGSPEFKGAVECLGEIFGYTVNSKGYKVLDSHVGLIYGDSITPEYFNKILKGLEEKGWSSDNIVVGIGSYTYQYVTRDTDGWAIKSTAVAVRGENNELIWQPTYKDPKTDNSGKKSARGLLNVYVDYNNGDVSFEDGLLELPSNEVDESENYNTTSFVCYCVDGTPMYETSFIEDSKLAKHCLSLYSNEELYNNLNLN